MTVTSGGNIYITVSGQWAMARSGENIAKCGFITVKWEASYSQVRQEEKVLGAVAQ